MGEEKDWELRIDTTIFGGDTIYVNYYGNKRFLEGDSVEFIGSIKGIQEYTGVMGNQIQIPSIKAYSIELKE
jgi:hypothetical protein